MKIVYHHRTRGADAQGVHIQELVKAFRSLGHLVKVVGLTEQGTARPKTKQSGDPAWKRLARRIPYASEILQLGYNLVGLPALMWKLRGADFLYERYSLFNFAGVIASRLCGKPIVLEVNSPLAHEQVKDGEIRFSRMARWSERVIANAATKTIVVSGPLRRMMTENGVAPERLHVMPNGVNIAHLRGSYDTRALRGSLGLGDRVVIGFIGWFKRWHGLEFLLETFERHGLAREGAALLLIGDGPAMPELREYASRRNLDGSVVFTGSVPHDVAPRYLDLIDIAVQPAANAYCCPIKILEYMALSKPIVAPRQENVRELLTDGHQALLFPPGDGVALARALLRLTRDARERARLGRSAHEAIYERGLLWTRNAQTVIDLLPNAAGAPAACAAAEGARQR